MSKVQTAEPRILGVFVSIIILYLAARITFKIQREKKRAHFGAIGDWLVPQKIQGTWQLAAAQDKYTVCWNMNVRALHAFVCVV